MSMIHGMIRFDGRPADPESLRSMLEAGKDACPDGAQTWFSGGAALGLGLLRTLPLARVAPGPVRDPESGLVIVADARIDNRPELRGKLGMRGNENFSDTELILRTYLKWGGACVEHLTGDFAFAIWDEVQRKLFCARDIFGINPFHYFRAPDCFIFSSDISSLLALREAPRDLDENAIADLLAGLAMEQGKTLYRGISTLPPAHCMSVTASAITLRRYWQPQAGEPIRFAREEEYVETYRALFEEAVSCRLETGGKVAGLLSGGLDSGAIAAVSGRMLAKQGHSLSTYSFVLTDEQRQHERDEKELIALLHGMTGINGGYITTRDFSGGPADLPAIPDAHLNLGHAPYLAVLFQRLDAEGMRVLLDGYGGDNCPTCASPIPLQEFLDGLQFARLTKYLSAASRSYGLPAMRRLLRMLREHFRATAIAMHSIEELVRERSVLSQALQQRVDIRARARENVRFQTQGYRSLAEVMIHRLRWAEKGFQHSPLFAQSRVERRFPLFDKRLVEFCLAVPAEQHNYDMNRRLMRRAMAGLLPDAIRLRHDKSVSNGPGMPFFLRENREYYISVIDAARNDAAIAASIDVQKLRKRFSDALPASYIDFMPGPTMRAFNLLLFLQKHR
ncbi:asparagine synthase (glutamine-hydrolysing) [Gammaproteobacteria bacterium]